MSNKVIKAVLVKINKRDLIWHKHGVKEVMHAYAAAVATLLSPREPRLGCVRVPFLAGVLVCERLLFVFFPPPCSLLAFAFVDCFVAPTGASFDFRSPFLTADPFG